LVLGRQTDTQQNGVGAIYQNLMRAPEIEEQHSAIIKNTIFLIFTLVEELDLTLNKSFTRKLMNVA